MKKYFMIFVLVFILFPRFSPAAERIAVLNGDALEVIRALKAGDMVVGVSDVIAASPSFWGEYSRLPMVGGWRAPDYEAIAKLKATVVVAYNRSPDKAAEKKLASLGIKVLRYDFFKISSFDDEVKEFAALIGREKEGMELINWRKGLLSGLEKTAAGLKNRPKVYIEGYGAYKSSGPGSGIHEIVTIAGGKNMAENSAVPYPEIEPEWVLSHDPDYIVKMVSLKDCYDGSCGKYLKQAAREISSRGPMRALNAVKNRHVIALAPDIGPGPRSAIGAIELAKRFHPDKFKDIDTKKIHSDYLKKFQGLEFSGVYIYPEGSR